jgi:dihydroorotase/N-acyl-D-amino-acid deacylase
MSAGGADFDILISGGRLIDGTGAPEFRGDVGIRGSRIAAVGDLRSASAAVRIDASGLAVAPGFIDLLGQSEFSLLVDNRAASKITQGVTTEVSGEGTSVAPVNARMAESVRPWFRYFGVELDWRTFSQFFARLEERTRPAVNLGLFVGAGSLRNFAVGPEGRPATPAELDQMRSLTAEAMEQGALGVSSSLQYAPDRFASTEELIAVASVAARYGGVYFTHQRSEAYGIFESLEEVFTIARSAGIAAEIWHLKAAYRPNWGRMPEVLARIEETRSQGLRITADVYPYDRSANGLDACLPLWAREGGFVALAARLADSAQRERIKREMEDPAAPGWENQWAGAGGAEGVQLVSVLDPAAKRFEGMNLEEIGRRLDRDPRDVLMDFVQTNRLTSSVLAIMSERDVRAALRHPLVSFCSDSPAAAEDGPLSLAKSHPRAWGSFPRILGRYVREEKLLTLEEAVRKMTSQAAGRAGIRDRGILRPGFFADLAVFDPETVRDRATYENPNRYSEGMAYVFVNGKAVLARGEITAERPGRVLRGPGYRGPQA